MVTSVKLCSLCLFGACLLICVTSLAFYITATAVLARSEQTALKIKNHFSDFGVKKHENVEKQTGDAEVIRFKNEAEAAHNEVKQWLDHVAQHEEALLRPSALRKHADDMASSETHDLQVDIH